jgi:hypothetical protein
LSAVVKDKPQKHQHTYQLECELDLCKIWVRHTTLQYSGLPPSSSLSSSPTFLFHLPWVMPCWLTTVQNEIALSGVTWIPLLVPSHHIRTASPLPHTQKS